MALYYTYHLTRAYKEMVSIMKEQIIMVKYSNINL